MFIARAVCGVTHVTVAALICSSSRLCISKSDWTTENEPRRSVSVNGNEDPTGEICHQYSSVVTAIIPYSRTIKLRYTLLGDYWECVRPARLPVLTWVPSSVPLGNNIQDTFLIGSATDTTFQWRTVTSCSSLHQGKIFNPLSALTQYLTTNDIMKIWSCVRLWMNSCSANIRTINS